MLVAARHGRTAWNVEGRFQGWADVPLDDFGRRQSEALARELADADLPSPTVLVSSDLSRARETARIVGALLGLDPTVERALREVDVGEWEGLTRDDVKRRFPEEWRRWVAGEDLARGGGEMITEAGKRVAGCVDTLLAATGPGTLIVVGHGISLQSALSALSSAGVIRLDGPAPHLGNGAWLAVTDSRHDQTDRLVPNR